MITAASDLFGYAAAAQQQRQLADSFEHKWLIDLATGHFKPRPREPIWQWADREVWLSEKMSAKAGRYDSSKTPWAREIQDLPRNPDVREAAIMKSSRTGITEGWLNVLRWMPDHWPGNALYAINERNLARQVSKRRIIPGIETNAKTQLTDDPNDKSLSTIALKNMDIIVSGSGSAGPFMEMWYRLIILDELENHIQTQDTTTEQRASSRQTDVDDGLIVKISKPEAAGGIIDLAYIRGTQKRYHVPCPRCERRIILQREGVVYTHCRNNDGAWDLERVVNESYRVCPHCNGRIDEVEKESMVDAGIWIPTALKDRRRPPDGGFVPPEPGVESYHISDWYSLHSRATTGEMIKSWLMMNDIQPTESSKKYFCTNHDGWPWEDTTYKITDDSIDALKAGRTEQREITTAKGEKRVITQTFGVPYRLAYKDGEFRARLPFRPAIITGHADKQLNVIKALIFAWMSNGDRYLIDICRFDDEDTMFDTLAERPYFIEKSYWADPDEDEPMFALSGLIDANYRPSEVYRACLRAHSLHGMHWWPTKGEGETDKSANRKLWRETKDKSDQSDIAVRMFYDHEIKNNFYLTRIQQRGSPRLWLPDDLPSVIYKEWTSESYDEKERAWVHNKAKGPNDYGDCGKSTELFYLERANEIKNLDCQPPRFDNSMVA
jgi:phage terminase large subunit GpA-like protein